MSQSLENSVTKGQTVGQIDRAESAETIFSKKDNFLFKRTIYAKIKLV